MIYIITAVIVFIFGLIIGSFLNVCIYRIPHSESIAFPPSHCTSCGIRLKPYDLIPVVSYIFLKGKCRNCGADISKRYPAIELLNGILYLLLFIQYGMTIDFIKFSAFTSIMVVIGMIDLDTMEVYFNVTVFALITAGVFILIDCLNHINISSYLLGALLGTGLIGSIVILTKGMGSGDIEIALIIGLFLGFKNTVFALFLSFIIGGIIAALLLISKKKTRKDSIAFGPFLAASSIIAALYGSIIVNYYIRMIMF
jgi:leader peptidase (prepilin peptidase)/N-methyltransferase